MIVYAPPVNTGLDIIYEDEDIIALNKPCGLLSVPGRGEDKQDCLVSRVIPEYPTALIVHRLDMSTSGIIVLALNKSVHRQLSKLFSVRKIHKQYIAVVDGVINEVTGKINQPLICDWPNRPKQIIDEIKGKASLTDYNVINSSNVSNTSRVELLPKTGRTHQLRVHMQYIGHAILGDELYGSEIVAQRSERLLLHATELKFKHPVSGVDLSFNSAAPF
jgi:tRNA pseudouridine32 synthase/23S rRNA pseudouridine746 synthase